MDGNIYIYIYIYIYDLALNNSQELICHKIQPNQIKPDQTIYKFKNSSENLGTIGQLTHDGQSTLKVSVFAHSTKLSNNDTVPYLNGWLQNQQQDL